jgi:C-terminal processing protease CtpA/Prc
MNSYVKPSAVAALGLVLMACSASPSADPQSSTSDLRSISTAEALADFDQISASFRSLYGALARKEARYGFSFEAIVTEYRSRVERATSEAEVRGLFQEFVSRFNDAHVSLSAELVSDDSHAFRLPFSVMPIEDTYVVYAVDPALGAQAPIKVGDEVLSIDGTATSDLIAQFSKYVGVPNALTRKHMAALRLTSRSIYLSANIRAGAAAGVEVRSASGDRKVVSLPWSEVPHLLPPVAHVPQAGMSTTKTLTAVSSSAAEATTAELTKMGARVPFFMTDAVKTALGVSAEVKPSATALAKYNLAPAVASAIDYFAVTYPLNGKKVLLVRLPDYEPADSDGALNYFRALFDDQLPLVDGLIFDETHNPGGSLDFASGVVSLLAKSRANGMVQEMHADRMWIQSFVDNATQVRQADPNDPAAAFFDQNARLVDDAYSANKQLSAPLSFFPTTTIDADAAHWAKPVMMLADELSVSCADFVPLLFKANGVGRLFGQTTMGGGGNVEEVATLTNTRTKLNLSRGLGTVFDPTGAYPEANFIEDNGVSPNITYSHTLADFRAGYVGYVNAFNAAFSDQLAH